MIAKYQKIADTIRSQINDGTYSYGSVLPTEQEFCQLYNVSRQTVRQALQSLVNEKLIERHQGRGSKVISTTASGITHRPRTVAVITTWINNYIFPALLQEVENVLSVNNYSTLLFATRNGVANERKILLDLLALPELCGIIVEGTKAALPNPNLDLYRQLQKRNIPIVFINACYQELGHTYFVLDDNYGGAYQLVQYLYSKGHRKIAGLFKYDDMQGHQRYAGYLAALRDMGLPWDDNIVRWLGTYSIERESFISTDYSFWDEFYEDCLKKCTAVVCYADAFALPLMQYLLSRGVKIPEDLAIVSFDNCVLNQVSPYHVTSLSHGDQNPGRIAAELLIKIKNNIPCKSQIIPWTLVEYESS